MVKFFLAILLFAAAPLANPHSRDVLLIHSYHNGLAWTDSVHRGFLGAISKADKDIDLHVEYLDSLRFRDQIQALRQNFSKNLQTKFAIERPAVIVAVDNDALDFALAERSGWAKNIPIVFCGINGLSPSLLARHKNITGVAEEASFGETLELIEQLVPGRSILVIGDETSTFSGNLSRLSEANSRRSNPARIEVYNHARLSAVEARLRNLSQDTAVFFMARPVDEQGETLSIERAVSAVSAASPQPVFSGWDFMLGYGIVGGKLISGEAQGETAAHQVLAILKGRVADDEPVVWKSPNRYLFDYVQLTRFNIDPDALPRDSMVINQPESFYRQHRDLVHVATLSFAILLLLVAYLSWEVHRRKRAEVRLHHLANHDALTELPNRGLLQELFAQARSLAGRGNKALALLFLDLDDFKEVNDSLGHEIGDRLLQEVAHRLSASVRTSDTVCRIGGDEFVVLLNQLDRGQDAALIAEKIGETMRTPFDIAGNSLNISFSIGIAMFPWDGQNFADLLRNADIAMYQAKNAGRSDYRFFNTEMNARIQRRIKIHQHLAGAHERGELYLHIQPQESLDSNCIVGAEALVRWNSPELGSVSPAEFIPVAESSGLIVGLGTWVFEEACKIIAAWQDAGHTPIPLAVNISVAQLRRQDFCRIVNDCLSKHNIAPTRIEIEITESIFMEKSGAIEENLNQLHAMGVLVAIDDFGTGYSNLGYLSHLHADRLKIDISFVRDICSNSSHAEIARAIVQIGHGLGMKTIAEGVEHRAQAELLRDLGCDAIQGYYLSKPMSVADFARFFSTHKARHQLTAIQSGPELIRTSPRTLKQSHP